MYIRFHSNANGHARGFRAFYSPLQIGDTIHLGCGPSSWNLAVNTTMLRVLYPDTGVSHIKLTNQYCTGRVMGDLVVFNQHYTECSSTAKTNADNVVYSNQLVYPESNTPFPIIVHGYRWKVKARLLYCL
ncbi:uncharacterized protein LOC127838255 [Dreissena polymorpha]|uniref:uncharacterized protein LOC127838255 n=1 Tax=Dreissena polymorpha TaxID=45954 RepID=UPI0022645291|nr:uncharacterized protein LOC127838255 [Dreissena polymorpha]